ncbi:D-aminoacyl-tRNA deacylase [Aestuariibius sp. HNIBRBA575]|uniref:D-aminoacyl-tRNA deacylase n=1 Tax=Aestuariibius sp. HNIBRBA575 TaxID=3233343 RepID=UPI0034A584D1
MRALIQRVSNASVTVDGTIIGEIGPGLLILVCAMDGDSPDLPAKMAAKISKLRIFKDESGKMNKSLMDIGGSALIVSQFTLAADTSRGNRPGFSAAARPDVGKQAYEAFCTEMRSLQIPVETSAFGADMQVRLLNDGPVTVSIEL